jgi:putative methyltransferase (TIGR04325 family)
LQIEGWISELYFRCEKNQHSNKASGTLKVMSRIWKRFFVKRPVANSWQGNYTNWQEARDHCTGYDDNLILNKVAESIHKVKAGAAAYERDSVAFEQYSFSVHVRDAMLQASLNNTFRIVDFGGSLGSLYFQYRRFLADKRIHWIVIEQSHFVTYGRKNLADHELQFAYDLDEACVDGIPDLLILSSVLCYLEQPYMWIEKFMGTRSQFILVDRTAFIEGPAERITVQVVPDEIYKASYPAWFLNEEKFIQAFMSQYKLVTSLPDTIDGEDIVDGYRVYRKGFLFERKS